MSERVSKPKHHSLPDHNEMEWNKISLMGLGLLGGSLGKAIIAGNHAQKIAGFVRRPEAVAEALETGVVHQASMDLDVITRDADLIILCTPILKMRPIVEAMIPHLKPGVIVTDVGSAKGYLVQELEPIIAQSGGFFIGSHPMAGSERQGMAHADPDLFKGAACVLTPTRQTPPHVTEKVSNLWELVGGTPVLMDPDKHDQVVAQCSHLPHLVAALLAHSTLSPDHGEQQASLCSSGFRDTTRVASGSPEMWGDIVSTNKKALLESLEAHEHQSQKLRQWIQSDDHDAILAWLSESKRRRDNWLKQYLQRPSQEDGA
jgi:prephenate dehydrogenase